MTLILRTRDDRFFQGGLRHFTSRFGISLTGDDASPLIRFEPTLGSNDDSPPSIHGWIGIDAGEVPLFERLEEPVKDGDAVLFLEREEGRVPVAWKEGNDLTIGFDLFRQVGICLSGVLDEIRKEAGSRRHDMASSPFCDRYMEWVLQCIREEHHRAGIPFVSKTLWPSRRPYAVCLTHDVDEVRKTTQWFTYPLRCLIRRDFRGLKNQFLSFLELVRGREPFWTFEKIMALEDSLGVRSSWYFLQESCKAELLDRKTWRHLGRKYLFSDPAVTDLIHRMDAGGWEIGLHGSFSSFTNCRLLGSELAALEQVREGPITGCRQHNLNLEVPETWRCQNKAGIQYDTTLGFNDSTGFRWGTAIPFHPFITSDQGEQDFLEIPLIIQDLPLLRGKDVKDTYKRIASDVRRYGGVLTLLWHHPVFNDNEFPGWGEVYSDIIRFCQQDRAWITSGHEIYTWWRRREMQEYTWTVKDDQLTVTPGNACAGLLLDISLPPGMVVRSVLGGTILWKEENNFCIRYDTGIDGEPLRIQTREADPVQ